MNISEQSRRLTYYFKIAMQCTLLSLLSLFMVSELNAQDKHKTMSLFDGASLQGWTTANPEYEKFWSVEDSMIIGGDGSTNIPANTFLHTKKEYENFELRCLFRLTGDPETGLINSGIQYRSQTEGGHMVGYQADIGNGYWGDIYDEHRRGKLIDGDLSTLKHLLEEEGWNSYIVRVQGDHHEIYINGVKTGDYVEKNPKIPTKGVIGFQLHSGGNAKLELRDITITELN